MRLRRFAGAALGTRSAPVAVAAQPCATMLELARSGPAPLALRRMPPSAPLSIAAVIPSFRRGSGGHATIARLLQGLRGLGHSVSVWLEDSERRHAREAGAVTERSFREFFPADGLEFHADLESWSGADVALATGWQTAARVLLLAGCGARAYLVQDHEPDFYGASAEAVWARETYRRGLHCIAASAWLAELLRTRYGARATHFDLAVDHAVYRPLAPDRPPEPDDNLVVFYARVVTPRRAVPLGLLALAELARRRPELRIALYGEDRLIEAPFAHSQLGVLDDRALAELYSRATVGMVLSLTNPSLIGLEMMACGLPCVELASDSMIDTFGPDGPLELAEPDPLALCDAIASLLDDPARRAQVSQAGLRMMSARTWARAAGQLEQGLRTAASEAQES